MKVSAMYAVNGGLVGMTEQDNGGLCLRALMDPFATAIFAKARAIRNLGAVLSPVQMRRLVESISEDVKKATNFHAHDVSVAAAEEAEKRGIGDLSAKTWHDQPKFDPRREAFIAEHMVPVSALVYACLKKIDEDAVLEVLTNRLRVVWLLRSEDKALTLLGFRHKRPDPEEAYRQAGIQVVSKRKREAS